MKRQGFTLIETLIGVGMFILVGLGCTYVIAGNIRSFETTTNQINSDQSASTALGIMSRDLQEAKQFTINSPTSLTVYYPVKNPDGTYDRNLVDSANPVTFYRGNPDMSANDNGTCLIKDPTVGPSRAISKCVSSLNFQSISASSVDVTLVTSNTLYSLPRSCQLIHRAIFLRNY